MSLVDWLLVALPIFFVISVAIFTQRKMRSVADFMSASRLAGPYLLAVAGGEMQAGAVVFVALFELISHAGFTVSWWQLIGTPIAILVAITGFVTFRLRETRAMTLAQFFELRYSKRFRVFTGMLAFLAGVINFGIIPAVGARFMVYYLGLPVELQFWGFDISTYIVLMACFLGITLFITLAGGFITVMLTDCVEGILSQLFYLVIVIVLVVMFSWDDITTVLSDRPAGKSMLNPFDSMGLTQFNIWYVLMGAFISVYGTNAWQNANGYRAAAVTPHASVMSTLLGRWRELGKISVVTLLAICAVTFLNHPDYAQQAAAAHADTAMIDSVQIQNQMEVPIALSYMLPIGVKGILCAILLMGIFGGDSTHLHSWGGIFVQDVLVPLRKKPFGPKQHIRALRGSIIGVAVFAFFFGTFFKQTEYIFMWWSVTMAVYLGGAGACIIGGLYWKKGTTTGAWCALFTGSGLSTGGILIRQIYGHDFPMNGIQISFTAAITAIIVYILVSLLTCRENYNLDRMLHRGKYAKIPEKLGEEFSQPIEIRKFSFKRLAGIGDQFSRGDKFIAGGLLAWSLIWFGVFLIGSIWNLIAPWPNTVWANYWRVAGIGIPITMTVVTGVWFTWGGIRDIRLLFKRLNEQTINHLDDGTVVGHQNLDERHVTEQSPK
ncbi:sodium:solute symporter family protein [Cerasicoccus frondis]|uniref:sodium:solute symporter family protein n=1 Tax=Cerasicoccus frondis TaxID=490090 RepID=UPI002852B43D|nr:hypothetical protein [Cerasicoccus frondis]